MNSKKLLGCRIKQIRKTRGYTQEKLAVLLEMDSGYICKMEAGRHTPSLETLNKLSKTLNIDISEFLNFDNLIEQDYKNKLIKLIESFSNEKIKQLHNIAKILDI